MNQAIHKLRLFFCFFSGEDDFIIRKCNARIQISFAFIGLLVLAIFIGCGASAILFMSHIFDNARWISFPVGIIWALLVINLYLLLLYTISPELLPVARKKIIIENGVRKKITIEEKRKTQNQFLNFSFLFRIGLITFLAIVIAQPLNVSFFAHNYEEGDKFAETIRVILSSNPLSWVLTTSVIGTMWLPIYFKYRVRKRSNKNFEKDFESNETTKGLKHLREQLGYTTDFENLYNHIRSIDINAIRTSDFYFQKSLIEYRIIIDEYEEFKIIYTTLLTERNKEYNRNCWRNAMPHLSKLETISPEKYQLFTTQLDKDLQAEKNDFKKYEYWFDHPFRTKHKFLERKLASEKELLKTFYQENK